MTKTYLSLCAVCVGGAVLLGQTVNGQVLPGPSKAKDKPNPKAKETPAPKDTRKPADTPRVTKKPVTPDDAKDARDDAKDRAKDTRDDVKDKAKDKRDDAKDRAKDTGDKVKDRTRDTRDDAKDARDDAKDRAKDRRDDAKDTAKDTKDRRDDAKDAAKDSKDRRDDAKDAKDTAKDAKASNDSKQARKFDAEKVKADDLGISFKEADKGIAVSNITRGSVLADAGFQSGDQIVSVNGQNVVRQNDFMRFLFGSNVSSGRVPVILMRGGARQTVYVQPATVIRNYETVVYSGRRNPVRDFGLVVDGRNDDHVYVERVIKDSRADQAGIQVDDEILAVNEQQVETSKDLARLLEKYESERIDMEVRRDREAKLLEVKVIR